MLLKRLLSKYGGVLVIAVIFVSAPYVTGFSNYWMTLLAMMAIYGITAVALNILIGYGGQISIGHAGFLMIGAYTVAIVTERFQIPFIVTFLLAGIVTAIIGLFVSLAAAKLRGHFLAVVTLGFGISVPVIAMNWTSVTNGYSGMLIPAPDILRDKLIMFYFVIFCTFLFVWLMYNIVNSSIGRAFVSIRESEKPHNHQESMFHFIKR